MEVRCRSFWFLAEEWFQLRIWKRPFQLVSSSWCIAKNEITWALWTLLSQLQASFLRRSWMSKVKNPLMIFWPWSEIQRQPKHTSPPHSIPSFETYTLFSWSAPQIRKFITMIPSMALFVMLNLFTWLKSKVNTHSFKIKLGEIPPVRCMFRVLSWESS